MNHRCLAQDQYESEAEAPATATSSRSEEFKYSRFPPPPWRNNPPGRLMKFFIDFSNIVCFILASFVKFQTDITILAWITPKKWLNYATFETLYMKKVANASTFFAYHVQ